MPIAFVLALVLAWQGVPQTLDGPTTATTAPGRQPDDRHRPDRLPGVDQGARQQRGRLPQRELLAPVREPHAAHELAGDAGHPGDARSPSPGRSGGWPATSARAGRSSPRWPASSSSARWSPCSARPAATRSSRPASSQALGNMEGKETRFGAAVGGLFAAVTTGTSTGAVNAMHDSFQPIAGLVPLFNIELGEITPGGIGAGLYGMLVIGCRPLGLHRRPDGRPDPGVPGQEDRGLRDEDGDARGARPGRKHPGLHGRWPPSPKPARPARSTPARTASARSCTPTPARPATTARRSPGSPATRPSTTSPAAWRCSSAATG